MTEPQQLCILVTLHPGGMTSEQHLSGEAIDITADGHALDQWEAGDACWHIVKSEIAEAVRAALLGAALDFADANFSRDLSDLLNLDSDA